MSFLDKIVRLFTPRKKMTDQMLLAGNPMCEYGHPFNEEEYICILQERKLMYNLSERQNRLIDIRIAEMRDRIRSHKRCIADQSIRGSSEVTAHNRSFGVSSDKASPLKQDRSCDTTSVFSILSLTESNSHRSCSSAYDSDSSSSSSSSGGGCD